VTDRVELRERDKSPGVLGWFAEPACHNGDAALDVYGLCRARHPFDER
jgi:hypothetical protein